MEHLALPPDTCEELIDPVVKKLVKPLTLQQNNHEAHSRGTGP